MTEFSGFQGNYGVLKSREGEKQNLINGGKPMAAAAAGKLIYASKIPPPPQRGLDGLIGNNGSF